MGSAFLKVADRKGHWAAAMVVLAALAFTVFATSNQIGGWNDASRLATVESLADHGTFAIEHSMYADLTCDKLWIDGHWYSDKSPVPAVFMAGAYRIWQSCTGVSARDCPEEFVWWMTFTSSGLAFVIAIWCVFQMGQPLDLSLGMRLGLTISFALATVAPVYAQQVNNHILLLAVTAGLMLTLAHLGQYPREAKIEWPWFAILGTLAGLGYTIDLGAGPMILACMFGLVILRGRSFRAAAVFLLAAAPWLALHHALNYAAGGTIRPANAVPEYLMWPGSPFDAEHMTGGWNHASPARFIQYALDLLFGKRGFLGHNLPLFLAVLGVPFLLRHRPAEWPEVVCAAACAGATWLIYAVTSTNSSGMCCSVRWFVPLLAPGYFVLAVLVRDHPVYRADLLILSVWGAILAAIMMRAGPWTTHMVPGFWYVYAAGLFTWGGYHLWRTIAAVPGTQYDQGEIVGTDEGLPDASPGTSRRRLAAFRVRLWNAPSVSAAEERAAAQPGIPAGDDSGQGDRIEGGAEEPARAEPR